MKGKAAAGIAVLALCACGGGGEGMPEGPRSFRVAVTAGDVGSSTVRLPFSLVGLPYTVRIDAQPAGEFAEGWVAVRAEPGDVLSVTTPDPADSIRSNVRLHGGAAGDVVVTVAKAYGDTRIWVEDAGFVPGPASGSACGNDVDDDGDGRTDYPDDPGCAYSNDQSESGGSHAVGMTGVLYFANPRIADVQGLSSVPSLVGRAVTIDEGDLVVVGVMVDALVVTDVSETRGYNSLLAYNYNTPAGIRVCDKLDALSGIVGEFYGLTELGFPSWIRDPDWPRPELPSGPAECPVPEPTELVATVLDDAIQLESLESSLVQVTGGVVTARFEDCDAVENGGNGNGSIDFDTPEEVCADDCSTALDCTELTSFDRYGQFGLATPPEPGTGEQRKVLVVARGAAPDFDVRANAGATLPLVRGILSEVSFLDQRVVELRCRDDLVVEGSPKPMWEACVSPPEDDEGYTR
ncbi:MAG: hypothetical protein HY905_21940 [Deltaproteobacteria bacterium]|nr:hypothetical protein [Deltaproteobacteria bacterium]